MIKKTTLYTLIFCLSVCTLIKESTAQTVLWKKDLKDDLYNVSWIEQTNDGTIIAAGDKGMMGIDNNTGNVLWTNNDLKAINKATFHSVDNLPIFHVEYTNMLGKSKTVLLDAYSGKVLFDSKDEDIKIGTNHLLPEISSILFEVKQEGKNKLLLFNYAEVTKKWMLELGEAEGGLKSLVKSAMGMKGFLKFPPVVIDNKMLLVGEKEKAHMIDISTGKMVWSQNMEDKLNALVYSPADKKVYLGIKKKLKLFDSNTGVDVTDGKMKLGSSLEQIFTNTQGKLVLVASDGFNLLDPSTGKFIWKKSYSQDGISQVIEVNGNYYVIGGEDDSSVLSKVDNNGERLWKEKIDGLAYYIKPIDKGIFYLSTEKSNIISYEIGEKIWKKDLKFKTIPSFDVDNKNNEVVFYESGELYKFNLASGNLEVLNQEIKLKKMNSYIFNLEVRPNGYLIHSFQHTAFVDRKGAISYNNFYVPISSIDISDDFLEVGAFIVTGKVIDIKGSINTLSPLDAMTHGSFQSAGDQNGVSVEKSNIFAMGDLRDPAFQISKKRYFNSKNTKDFKYILTNATEGNQIIRVNKDGGNIDKKINLVDKTPNYIADEIDDRVFINESNRHITCYNMK